MMAAIARGQATPLVVASLAGIVRQIGFLSVPWCLQRAVDDGLVAADTAALTWWAVAVLAACVVQFLGMCCWDWFANLADARAGIVLRADLVDQVVEGVGEGRGTVGAGDLILRVGRDVDLLRVWVHGLPTWSVVLTTVVVLVPGMLSLSPLLFAVAAATVPCLVVVGVIYPRRYESASAALAEAHGARADHVDHIIGSAVTSRGIGGGPVLVSRHHASSAGLTITSVRTTDLLARWQAWGVGVPTIAVAVGLLVGVTAVIDGSLTVGGLVAFSTWMATIGIAVEVALMRVVQTLEARVAADRLSAVLGPDLGTRGPEEVDAEPVAPIHQVEVIAADTPHAVVLAARVGELVVVTGPTGSGKSSLLRSVAGGDGVQAVRFDGLPVHHLSRRALARRVVMVPQRPLVLEASVRENLSLGSDVPDSLLLAALADVDLAGELDLDDQLEGGAGSLSGGQVQRLALARAYVCDPAVLLLDDVTSAVDETTERHVVEGLRRRMGHRVVVVVSHRRAVIEAADRVVTMGSAR